MEEKINPKALNLEVLKNSVNKVTLGFKCAPEIKLLLAQEANQLGLTLSEHVENLILNKDRINSNTDLKLIELTHLNTDLKERIKFFENDFLKELFNKYEGKSINYLNNKSETIKLKITELKDIYTVIINSFKITK